MRTSAILLSVVLGCGVLASAAGWRPIDPADLALKTPKLQNDADAEAIFWDIRVDDQGQIVGSFLSHYLRIKVFTERGCEQQGKV